MGNLDICEGSQQGSYFGAATRGLKRDKIKCPGGYAESHSSSCSSLSSNSTAHTASLTGNRVKRDGANPGFGSGGRSGPCDPGAWAGRLELVYEAISELYEEEIVPSVHEIRRKLNRRDGLDIEGQLLLDLCSADARFKLARLPGPSSSSRDVQNRWAILIRKRPCTFVNRCVDSELLLLVSNYLVFICSGRYEQLAASAQRGPAECVCPGGEGLEGPPPVRCPAEEDVEFVPLRSILGLGGRYLFAEHLKRSGPRRLRELPLGALLLLVQKLNELGLLVYSGNCLVPVAASRRASSRLVLGLAKALDRDCTVGVRRRVESLLGGGARIPLCSLPKAYRSAFGEDLSYPEMGYRKLSDFLRNEVQSCRITEECNTVVVSMLDRGDVGADRAKADPAQADPVQPTPRHVPGPKEQGWAVSQIDLNVPQTTLLFPLKISGF